MVAAVMAFEGGAERPWLPHDQGNSAEFFDKLSDPWELVGSTGQGQGASVAARLRDGSAGERRAVISWLLPVAPQLAFSLHGCRVLEKALEVADLPGLRSLATALQPHTVELYESPHGNHVLSKVVEMLPSSALVPIIEMVRDRGVCCVARHQFGCRVVERLVEYCTEAEVGGLVEEIVENAEPLSRHPYGNFVVQRLLMYASPQRRRAVVLEKLLGQAPYLATHRVASHVVQRCLDYGDDKCRQALLGALLSAGSPYSLLEVAGSRYGSFVVSQLAGLEGQKETAALRERLALGKVELEKSQYGRRVSELLAGSCNGEATEQLQPTIADAAIGGA